MLSVIPFPFSDLSTTKRRPALVLAELPGDDVILCQITRRVLTNANAVAISSADFTEGNPHQDSNIRPDRLFTADSHIIVNRAGKLSDAKLQEVVKKVVQIISA